MAGERREKTPLGAPEYGVWLSKCKLVLREDTGHDCDICDTYTDKLWCGQHGHCTETQLSLGQQLLWQGLLV